MYGMAAPGLMLMNKNKKRKQDGRRAVLRMFSSRTGRSATISDFNATFAQDYAPAALPGQAFFCNFYNFKWEMRLIPF
jgi:hypothetical protein